MAAVTNRGLSIVTLKDGYEMTQGALDAITMNLKAINRIEPVVALYELIEKCKDASYKISPLFGSVTVILKERQMLDERDNVKHEDTRRVVLNSLRVNPDDEFDIQFVNPLKS